MGVIETSYKTWLYIFYVTASEESTVSGVSSASSTVKKVDITASKKEATASKTDDKVYW